MYGSLRDDLTTDIGSPIDRFRPVLRFALSEQFRKRRMSPRPTDHQMIAFDQYIDLCPFGEAELLQHRLRQPDTDAMTPFL